MSSITRINILLSGIFHKLNFVFKSMCPRLLSILFIYNIAYILLHIYKNYNEKIRRFRDRVDKKGRKV